MKKKQQTNGTDAANGMNAALKQELKRVPWAQVRPDPNQPRKHFDAEKLKELADSIAETGIAQPLLVEWLTELKIAAPDGINTSWQAVDGKGAVVASGDEAAVRKFAEENPGGFYKIVDGERRWRAAELANLEEVPVLVVDLEEKKRFALQYITNQQHENLTALEEAAAFKKEIEEGRHTAETLYKALGISRATVFGRLALTRLQPAVREAVEAGKISVSVAGLIAQLPGEKAQVEVLKKLTDERDWNYPYSFRDAQELVERDFMRQLKGAPFDLEETYASDVKLKDGAILMLASRGPCTECRYRSGNMKEEFPDIKNINVCTQPECWVGKQEAAVAKKLTAAKEEGQPILSAKEAEKIFRTYECGGAGESGFEGAGKRTDSGKGSRKGRKGHKGKGEEMKTGIELIAEERARQVSEEGWTAEYDDVQHANGQLAAAGACYAWLHANYLGSWAWRLVMACWPWATEWWKPVDPVRDLVKAGALIAAEIDRLQRKEPEQETRELVRD